MKLSTAVLTSAVGSVEPASYSSHCNPSTFDDQQCFRQCSAKLVGQTILREQSGKRNWLYRGTGFTLNFTFYDDQKFWLKTVLFATKPPRNPWFKSLEPDRSQVKKQRKRTEILSRFNRVLYAMMTHYCSSRILWWTIPFNSMLWMDQKIWWGLFSNNFCG